MKILQVCPRYPPQTGGVETHVKEISERLADRGHEVTVLSADAGMEGARRERRNGVDVRRHRSFTPSGAVHFAPGITRSIQNSAAGVVHAHNYHSMPLLFAALGVDGTRFIVTPHYHGSSDHPVRDRLLEIYRPAGRWALSKAETVTAVSEWERRQLEAEFDIDVRVVQNGVNVERLRTAIPEVRENPYLIAVGRLTAYKRIDRVIMALAELEGFDFIVVGEGPAKDKLKRVAIEAEVQERVTFSGFVDEQRLASLYAGAAVLVNLSKFESFGLTVAEALGAGTPCVVGRDGALADWKSVAGVVTIDDLSPIAIAESVRRAADLTPDPEQLSDWSDVVQEYETIYASKN